MSFCKQISEINTFKLKTYKEQTIEKIVNNGDTLYRLNMFIPKMKVTHTARESSKVLCELLLLPKNLNSIGMYIYIHTYICMHIQH